MNTQQTSQQLTQIEKKIIASLQGDIPVIKRPYLKLAQDMEKELLTLL